MLDAITGLEAINTPKAVQSAAPSICNPRSIVGRRKKYEPTKTAVAAHPRASASDESMRLAILLKATALDRASTMRIPKHLVNIIDCPYSILIS